MFIKNVPMTRSEPQTAGVKSNRSANWATFQPILKLLPRFFLLGLSSEQELHIEDIWRTPIG